MHDLGDRLAADLDQASDQAPHPGPALDTIVDGGRRALLRRRFVLGAGTAAAVLAVGGVLWGFAPGGGTATDHAQVATQPDGSASPSAAAVPPFLEGDALAGYGPDGTLVVRDGWTVTERIANPAGRTPPAHSVALELTDGHDRYWYFLQGDEDGYGVTSDPAQKGFATLEEWTASQVDANQPDPIGDALELRSDGTLVSSDDGVVVVDQRTGVDLGASFGPAADTTVAELRVDGVRWFVTALDHVAGGWELGPPIDTPRAGTSLDTCVDYLRAQYASGEGVR